MSAERSIEAVNEFCSNSPVNIAPLEGNFAGRRLPSTLIAYYPDNKFIIYSFKQIDYNVSVIDQLRERVGRLKPSEFLTLFPQMQDSDLRKINEKIAEEAGEPIAVVEFGITAEDEEDYSVLYFIMGMSPQTALESVGNALTSALPLT